MANGNPCTEILQNKYRHFQRVDMETKIVAVTEDNLQLVRDCGSKWGMPRSVGWLRRVLFDPTVEEWTQDKIRGHMSIDEAGNVLAIQCYYYQPCYLKQKKFIGTTGAIMGADSKYGEELLRVLDRNTSTQEKCVLAFGNCIAGKRSAKVNRVVHKMCEPPYRPGEIRIGAADLSAYPIGVLGRIHLRSPIVAWLVFEMFRPLSWLAYGMLKIFRGKGHYRIVPRSSFDDARFDDFWSRFLSANDGLISSRDPRRLRWLFNDSIKAGKVLLATAEKEGRIDGYVLLRVCEGAERVPRQYDVVDICAVGNDSHCLRDLSKGALRLAGRNGGLKVFFVGGMPKQEEWLDDVFPFRHQEEVTSFMYVACDPEVRESLKQNKGWFFGPFDGERCMGHGGDIDL